jgi:trimeric autotransporter adhesin
MEPKSVSKLQFKTITRRLFIAMSPAVMSCFAFVATTQAVVPAPDGGYPNANTAEGENALFSLTTGMNNTAVGFQTLALNSTGGNNTGLGSHALFSNTTGTYNTATGQAALASNNVGNLNTATGAQALVSNRSGIWNTATGVNALYSNTTGRNNTATGVQALYNNTTASNNTADGTSALFSNTTGHDNTGTGTQALFRNTTGFWNTGNGVNALLSNTTGGSNTATGVQSLAANTTGSNNTANGTSALFSNTTGFGNTAVGEGALYNNNIGVNNIALGVTAGHNLTTGGDNIDIGNPGVAGEGSAIRIGMPGFQLRTYIAGIRGTGVSGAAVTISSSGQLGVAPSSARFKEEIKAMDNISEAILALKPVTFRYKKEVDPERTPQFGLIAEEVAAVNPDLVARDEKNEIYTVRYDAVNAMLLNEFLKEHRMVEELKGNAEEQRRDIQVLAATVKEQASLIQKVSAQLQIEKPRRQVVLNTQ